MTDDLVKQSFYDGYQEGLKCGEAKSMNRIEQLEAALMFYRDGFYYHPKRTVTGVNVSEWLPTEELLNDCGENARAALAGEKKDDHV